MPPSPPPTPVLSLTGKTAVITAGAQGIGRSIAATFLAAGARVHLCDVDAAALQATLAELSPTDHVTGEVADVADPSAVERMFAGVAERFAGRLDILVNNAGIGGPTGAIETLAVAEWQRTIEVNLNGMFYCLRAAVPLLKANGGGAIINLASAAAKFGFPLRAPYAASKFAVIGLTETLAIELGPAQIRVNAILPGVVAGPRQDRVLAAKAAARGVTLAAQREAALARVSMGVMVEAADIANAALFLASDAGRFVSGERLGVGGNVEGLN